MLTIFQNGGPMMWLLAVISVCALFLFLKSLLHLHRAQMKSRAGDFLHGLFNVLGRGTGLEPDSIVEAITICSSTAGPVAEMTRGGLLEIRGGVESVLRGMERAALKEIARLEKNLNLLLTLAQVAPLCGLLGTVLGLVQMMSVTMQKAPLIHAGDLGAGMWQALLASAAGIMIAIPAYAGYNLLVSRVESIVLEMEQAFMEVHSGLVKILERQKT